MGHRDMIWSRHQPAQLLAWGIRFFLAAALTATQTPGDYAPFALGCVAACGPGAGGIAALLGAGVGAVLFLDFSGALPFLAAAILIFTTAAAFQGLKLLEGPLFHPLAGAGLFLAVSGIYVLQSLSPLRNLAPCLAATALVGISAWYYQPLLQAGGERPEPDSLLFLAGSILLALVDVELAGVSVGRSLLCLLLAYTALFPDNEVLFMFIIPMKLKWLGLLEGALLGWLFIIGSMADRVALIFSLLNFLLFFGPRLYDRIRNKIRYEKFRRQMNQPPKF